MLLRTLFLCVCLGSFAPAALPPGFPLADVPISTAPGKPKIDLKRYRGKPVILLMISLTCGHCVNAAQVMNDIQKEYRPRGLQVVGVAGGTNANTNAGGWGAHFAPEFPFGYLEKDDFLKLAGLPPDARPFVPVVLFIDPQGMVRLRLFGNDKQMKNTSDALTGATKELMAEVMPLVHK
ncbi:MAG TPA: TlpA disulfide reductase family protein [Bryobacteraceae bacterium]|nr:TlpA disulfide reductase family protein [Bryobacteraceae bacterium]